jgi:UDP-glucose:(heptosyl)LPS alpha-1,3-glucosyltransferase
VKIGLLLEHFDAARGGLEAWAVRFANWLVARGHEVHVLAFDAGRMAAGVVFHPVPQGATREASAWSFAGVANRLALDSVQDLGVGLGADLLQPHYGSRVACAEAEVRALPWPSRWRKHISPLYRRRIRALARFEQRQIDAARGLVLVPSQFAGRPLVDRFGLNASALRVVPNGVDGDSFHPEVLTPLRAQARAAFGLAGGDVAFLEIAVNFRLKGVATALRALRRLPRRVRLVVVGAGDAAFVEEARGLGVGDRVCFAGVLRDVRPAFAAADACVHPSWHDACSLGVLEAWAAGLPAITTRCNGASELMSHGEEGFVLDQPGDDARLAEWMGRLLDADTRAIMSEKARSLAARHSFEGQFAGVLALHEARFAERGPVGAAALRAEGS